MKRWISSLPFAAALAFLPLAAGAVPALQLDIAGGTYDPVTETIVTTDPAFTLYAYGTPGEGQEVLDRTLYLSIALTPPTGPDDAVIGSFEVNGVTYSATADMTYGVPPIESDSTAAHDGGDLGGHGVFETFFIEIPFTLTAASPTSGEYNTQDDAGQGPIAGDDMFYAAFDIDRSGLPADYGLHFDLYATQPGRTAGDTDIDFFAPFSHDAGTGRPIPEPTAALVFAAGLFATRFAGRRRS